MQIKRQLNIALGGIALLTVASLGLLAYFSANQLVESQALAHLDSVAEIQRHRLETLIQRDKERLSLISSRTQMRISLDKYNNTADPQSINKVTRIIDDALKSVPAFKTLSIANLNGDVVASTDPAQIGLSIGSKDYFQQASRYGFGNEYIRKPNGTVVNILAGLLTLQEKTIGVAFVEASTRDLLDIVENYTGLGETGETLIISEFDSGQFMYITNTRFNKSAALSAVPDDAGSSKLIKSLSSLTFSEKSRIHASYGDDTAIYAARAIPNENLFVVVKRNQSDIFSATHSLKVTLISFALMCLLIAVIVSAILSRILVHPLQALVGFCEKYIQKKPLNKDPLNKANEFDVLSMTLRQMTAELVEAKNTMESRVEERTKYLLDANEKIATQAESLLAANKHKNDFLANMSHELRTPLNSILILSKLLGQNKDNHLSETEIKHANIINSAGTDLLELINDLLDMAKMEANEYIFELKPTNIREIIFKIRDIYEVIAEKNNNKLTIKVDELIPQTIITDQGLISKIVKNLISNALKFTHNGRVDCELNLTTVDDSPFIVLTVADTGKGIPEAFQSEVFEAFKQVDSDSNREFDGTGLGLAIMHQSVVLLNGSINLESEENKGSKFTVTLPLKTNSDQHTAELEHTPSEPEKIKSKASGKILIVDDEPFNIYAIEAMLEDYDYEILSASNGLEALEKMAHHNFDIVLMDMMMPKMDGFEATKAIRKNAKWDKTKIIALTARAMESDQQRCFEVGVDDFISKPIDFNLFLVVLDKYLRKAAA